jgi:hypothetical protein
MAIPNSVNKEKTRVWAEENGLKVTDYTAANELRTAAIGYEVTTFILYCGLLLIAVVTLFA